MSNGPANGAYWVRSEALGSEWEMVWVTDALFPNAPKRAYVFGSDNPYAIHELTGEWREVPRPA